MKPNEPLLNWGFEQLGPTSLCGFFILSSVEETTEKLNSDRITNCIHGGVSLSEIFLFAHLHQEAETNKDHE